ncbi:aminotransferase class III-fold pyridoxal phosphate-dependent enzyme [Tistrella mobilis]
MAEDMRTVSPAAEAVAAIVAHITRELAHALDQPPESIDPDLPFVDMGADSLILAEALQDINQHYGVSLPIGEIYERVNTIARVAGHVHTHGRLAAAAPAAGPAPAAAAPMTTAPMASAPMASARPAPVPSAEEGVVEEIVRRQLELMEQQLRLLGGQVAPTVTAAPAAAAAAVPAPAAAPVRASPPASAQAGASAPAADRFSAFDVRLEADMRRDDPQKRAVIDRLARDHNSRTGGSKSLAQDYRRVLACNRVSAGFRPLLKEMVYPVLAETAHGATLVDIDGNSYVDFTMGFGVHLFGHAPAFIMDRLRDQLERGMAIGPQAPLSGPVAAGIARLTGHDRVVFCNSGTEATMTALRLARARVARISPGREAVVIFRNSYHGSFDGFLARSGAGGETRPASLGTPASAVADTVVLDYCDPAALAWIEANRDRVAAVLVEPVQSRAPSLRPGPFLAELRRITAAHDIVLIFDEVIAGFRCAPGGAQAWFGVRADMCTYGKVVGGGMPIGVVAGSADCMDGLDGGWWQYGDASQPTVPTIFFAGTFSKHPLTMAAALAVLEHLEAEGPALQERLNATTDRLAERLIAVFDAAGADVTIEHFSSLFRFASRGNLDVFFQYLLANGIYIWEGRNCFLSTAHTEADLDRLVEVVAAACAELLPVGLMPVGLMPAASGARAPGTQTSATPDSARPRPLSDAQQRFRRLDTASPEGRPACNVTFGFRFDPPVDVDRLAAAVLAEMRHHDALAQRPDPQTGTWTAGDPARIGLDERREPGPCTAGRAEALMAAEQAMPLDLAAGETVRLRLYRFDDGGALLGITAHHIVCDGWSLDVLLRGIAARMSGETLPAAPSHQAWLDHEAAHRAGPRQAADQAYWTRIVDRMIRHQRQAAEKGQAAERGGETPRFSQGRIAPRPGGRARTQLDPAVAAAAAARARAEGTTTFTWLLACTWLFFSRVSRDRMPVIGLPFANRTAALRGLVANCVNLLPMLPPEDPASGFDGMLAAARAAMNDLMTHARFPYADICDAYRARAAENGGGVAGRETPVDVTFNLEPITGMPSFGGSVPELIAPANAWIEFDLMINVFMLDEGLRIELDYDTRQFSPEAMHGWLNLLAKIIENQATARRIGTAGVAAMPEALAS